MPLAALFFDVGNTLLFPNRERMLPSVAPAGCLPFGGLAARSGAANQTRIRRFGGERFFRGPRLLADLSTRICSIGWARPTRPLGHDLVTRTRISANWCDIRPGTREALLRLAEKYRLAVISNADGKIADVLARTGIADCFETITDSGIVGKEKPHPAIFEAALSSMGVAAAGESLHRRRLFGGLSGGDAFRNARDTVRCGRRV